MQIPTEAAVVCIDSFGDNDLIVATDRGEITLTSKDAPVIQTKNDARVTDIISINRSTSLVFSERSTGKSSATAYQSNSLNQIPGLTLHEVLGGSLVNANQQHQHQHQVVVAVYTPAALRILRFDLNDSPKAKILRTIELKGIIACCSGNELRAGSRVMLIATATEYTLVNLDTQRKIPLFPIMNGLKPLMVPVGSNFLVVQGTASGDPAMGLFVDHQGDVACQGNVIQWPAYPTSLASSGNYIFSVSDGRLIIHAIDAESSSVAEVSNIAEVAPKIAKAENVKCVFKLSDFVKCPNDELLDRLGDPSVAYIETDIVFLMQDNSLELWTPASKPLLLDLEAKIRSGELRFVEPDPKINNTEQYAVELDYLDQYLMLHLLHTGEAFESTSPSRGSRLDIDLVLYIYGYKDELPRTYPGLKPLIESLRKTQRPLSNAFLISSLKTAVKKLRRDSDQVAQTKKYELLLAQRLLATPVRSSSARDPTRDPARNPARDFETNRELTRMLLERGLKAQSEILEWLRECKKYSQLEEFYNLAGKTEELAQLQLTIIRDPDSSAAAVKRASRHLIDAATSSAKSEDLWNIAMELIRNPRTDTSAGLTIIQSPAFEASYDPNETLQALKEFRGPAAHAWRDYLEYLVHARGLFRDDLVMLVVTDICKHLENSEIIEQICACYHDFKEMDWPKAAFREWLRSGSAKPGYPAELRRLQYELWDLMEGDLDWVQLMPVFESQLSELKIERAVIYQKLGLHEQSLLLLSEITDYRTLIAYASRYGEKETRHDIAYLTLRVLLDQSMKSGDTTSQDSNTFNAIFNEFLTTNEMDLDTDTVLRSVDASTPFHVLANFVLWKVQESERLEHIAHIKYVTAKGSTKDGL